ncbi:MAG: response regulator, partial [Candidatus Sericytochromatia bacterium]
MVNEKKKKILLIEDELSVAIIESKKLQDEGYSVIHTQKAQEAIDIVYSEKEDIDLLLIDIELNQELDGTEVAQKILEKYNIPVVFISGHTEKEIVQKTEKISSYGYVVKNTAITVLNASIKMAFKLFEANKKIKEELLERKKNEDEINRLNRLYLVISQINQMIVREKNKSKIFEEVCKIAVDFGKFRMSWIGLIDPEELIVKPYTFSGFEDGYLSKMSKISVREDLPEGRGPTGIAIRNLTYFCNNDMENASFMSLWRDEAIRRGYRSSISLPIIIDNKVEAQCENSDQRIIVSQKSIPLSEWNNGCVSSVEYVTRTRETISVSNAIEDQQYGFISSNGHVIQQRVKSLLVMPVVRNNELKAILYLENNLIDNCFIMERVNVLNILTGQMA